MKATKYTKQDYSLLRQGLVVKEDNDGNILLGNGTNVTNFAAKIKGCKAAQVPKILNNVKCFELHGKCAPKDGCKVVGQNIEGMVNQYGSEVEEVRFLEIEIDIDGFSTITATCHKVIHMYLYKAAVKYLLKHRIDNAFWTLINRNLSVKSLEFEECDLGQTFLLLKLITKAKKEETKLQISIEKPQFAVDDDCSTALEVLFQENYIPESGRVVKINLGAINKALKTKILTVKVGEADSEETTDRKNLFLQKSRLFIKVLDEIEKKEIPRNKVKVAIEMARNQPEVIETLADILENKMQQVDQVLEARKHKKKAKKQKRKDDGEKEIKIVGGKRKHDEMEDGKTKQNQN